MGRRSHLAQRHLDPDLNLLYWTTGNPWPDFYGGGRRGDNLYSCSVIALDLETGS